MIVNSAPQDLAIVHNVNSIGEFRIKNSYRAFEILSSGLYSNKILAIVRELSCNAYDSHVAAGKHTQPFDVHLPNQLEPWFSIRDYGVGLSHDQVVNIYTTYFETTKSESNDYIGALGLGSKSPFSYTDNFTVIAIKDRRRGIYTAFINELGMPSIALMYEEDSDEPTGLEVKFAVTKSSDYYHFLKNAQEVYAYFDPKPVVSGVEKFVPNSRAYEIENIIDGVHVLLRGGYASKAVMGNVAYAIDVPERRQRLGDLSGLLNSNLELNFSIGDLDVQASREGLAYTAKTLAAIEAKLTAVAKGLTVKLTADVNQLENNWLKAQMLVDLGRRDLWTASANEYVANTGFEWVVTNTTYGPLFKRTEITSGELASKFNINATWFSSKNSTIKTMRPSWNSDDRDYTTHIFMCNKNEKFVVNDTNVGAVERVKHHWRTAVTPYVEVQVCVLSAIDRAVPAKFAEFFEFIGSPPADYVFQVSNLIKKTKVQKVKLGSILQVVSDGQEISWRKVDNIDAYKTDQTYYYIPLSGFSFISKYGYKTVNAFFRDIKDIPIAVPTLTPYGVRKSEIEAISALSNWINLEDYVAKQIQLIDDQLVDAIVKSAVRAFSEVPKDLLSKLGDTSLYKQLVIELQTNQVRGYYIETQRILDQFAPDRFNIVQRVADLNQRIKEVEDKYPLLNFIHVNNINLTAVAEYINLIDNR